MWAGLLSVVALLAVIVLPAGPAQAYGTVGYRVAIVDTGDCHRISGVLTVYAESGGCRLYDSADGTYFVKDAGGAGLKVELVVSGVLVGKAEFHPYGEKFWYYDTRNDGDGLYYELCTGISQNTCYGPYIAPGTDKVIDYGIATFSFTEGTRITVRVYDGAGRTDLIGSFGWAYA